MRITSRGESWQLNVIDSIRRQLLLEHEPTDLEYGQRLEAETIGGFSVLSFLLFASMMVLFCAQSLLPLGISAAGHDIPTMTACGIIAGLAGLALMLAGFVRSRQWAVFGTAVLLASTAAVLSVDTLHRLSGAATSRAGVNPLIFTLLLLSALLVPLRPVEALIMGVLAFASSAMAAGAVNPHFRADVLHSVSAATALAASVMIASRSASHRIRIYRAHISAIEAEREAEATRERALIAESAITMERLAASLSHEMNTPIGTLRSATETLIRGVGKEAVFPPGSRMPQMVEALSAAISGSTSRLSETVSRIQRFANLDRSAVRLVDVNQLVQDAVALMNPPSAEQTQMRMNLQPLPQIWCKPHGLSVAIASVLNTVLDASCPVRIQTWAERSDIVVRVSRDAMVRGEHDANLRFAVVDGRVRASGWDLFAARQLVRENGGELRLESPENSEYVVTITVPAHPVDDTLLAGGGQAGVLVEAPPQR